MLLFSLFIFYFVLLALYHIFCYLSIVILIFFMISPHGGCLLNYHFNPHPPTRWGDVLLTSAKRSSMSFQSTSPYTGDDICHIMSNKFHKQLSIVSFQKDKYFSFLYPPQEEYPHQEIYKDVQQ